MTKELWLLRHGKSNKDVIMDDFDRPLKKRGEQESLCMGVWMKQEKLIPDAIISSPANRAISTAIRLSSGLGIPQTTILQDPRLYFKGIGQIKALLTESFADIQRILLVGHNPDFEALLIDLVSPHIILGEDKLLATATLARMRLQDWRTLNSGCAELVSITRAKHLSNIM